MRSSVAVGARAVLQGSAEDEISRRGSARRLERVDLICAGVPCQDVSVAGKRAGLAGARTGLFYEFARILKGLRPAWFLFENVPGLLSSNEGRDFAEVQRVFMVECGYGIQWRILDSQFFGVAQRRRRLFVVGSFGKPCPPEVLFEQPCGSRNPETGREVGEDIAFALAASVRGTGDGHGNGWNSNYAISPPLTSSIAKNFAGSGHGNDGCGTMLYRMQGFGDYEASASASKARDFKDATDLVLSPNPKHQERSSQQFDPAPEVDGAMLGNADDGAPSDSNRVRDFASLPLGLDSARYRALGNAVTVSKVKWIIERIKRADYASRLLEQKHEVGEQEKPLPVTEIFQIHAIEKAEGESHAQKA